MAHKRAADSVSRERAEKMLKLTNGRSGSVKVSSNTTMSRIQELKRALDKNNNHSHVLHLAREIANTPDLPLQFTIRLLKFCIEVGSEFVMRQLLSTQTINLKTPAGGELLWAAVEKGQEDIIMLLVRSGVDLSVRKPGDNSNVLHKVVGSYKIKNNAKREEIVKLMLDNGADVNARNNSGYSVLHEAISNEHCSSQLVDELLKHGAQVTTNEFHLNDLYPAARKKPELLLKLIEHLVPDELTRNKRGFMVIEHFLVEDSHGIQLANSMRMIKNILDLGVPANTPDPHPEERNSNKPSSLLNVALHHKKKDAVKMLLDYGADPHQKDERGNTPLYLATAFKGYTNASRWLIEKGASIQTRNDNGSYPIHGACRYDSLRNIHLFLNLGADLNVTDNEGLTPFMYTGDAFKLNDAHRLVIKHFVLILAKGGSISEEDNEKANQYVWGNHHFKKCKEELERMKKENICDDVSYFSLFTKNMYEMLQLMKNSDFVTNFKQNSKKQKELFPVYYYMLLHSFEIAEKRYEMFVEEKKKLKLTLRKPVPDCVLEKKTYNSCLEKLERCQYDFFMDLHANLKNTKADKEKIL